MASFGSGIWPKTNALAVIAAVAGIVVSALIAIVVVTIFAPTNSTATIAVIVGAVIPVTGSLLAIAKASEAVQSSEKAAGKVDKLQADTTAQVGQIQQAINGRLTEMFAAMEQRHAAELQAERDKQRAAFLTRMQAGESAESILRSWAEKGALE